jgi:O-antigen/teichoic acid export membrane protein
VHQQPTPDDPAGMTPLAADAEARRRVEMGGDGLRGRVAHGTIVNTVYLVCINGLTIVQGILAANLIGPNEYGVWGLITISFGTLFALAAIGIGDKYIQQDHPDQRAAFEISFTLQCMLVGVFTVVALIGIPLFSLLYDEPRMLLPGLLLAATMPLLALQAPMWVFYRRMNFVTQRLLQAVSPVITFVVTIPLAATGFGLWSFVAGNLAAIVVSSTLTVAMSPYKLRFRYERGTAREYASFSWPLMVSSGSVVLMFQVPITIASRSLGASAVGAIALASQITQYTRRVDDIVTTAMYPAICIVKDNRDLLYESFSKANRIALLWGFPAGVAVALFAPVGVPLVLGERWEFAVTLIQLLGVSAALNMIGFNWTAFARARAETRVIALATVLSTIAVISVGVPLLLSHGIAGFGWAMISGTLTGLVVRHIWLVRLFPPQKIAFHVLRSFVPTLPAAAGVLASRAAFGANDSVKVMLAEIAAYSVLVLVVTWLTERKLLREALDYLRQRARKSEAQIEPATRLA